MMTVATRMMAVLVLLTSGRQVGVAVAARPRAVAAEARAITLDVRGPADEATALRATLQELTARRHLAFTFESPVLPAQRAAEPWATVIVDLEGQRAPGGAILTLRDGATGRVQLHRVVPDGPNHQVTIETLATIAYTALETLALDPPQRSSERPVTAPRERAVPAPERELPAPEVQPANESPANEEITQAPLPAPQPTATVPPSAVAPTDPVADGGTVTVSARAGEPATARTVATFPVRFSLASFAGYQAGNLFGADRHATSDWWGMGITAAATVCRWPMAPTLGLGLGAWYGTGRAPLATDGSPRPAVGPRLQGQAELRLTALRRGRFSAALGPWLTVSRTTFDFGPAPPGPRGPGPNQGPPAPNALDAPVRATRVSIGLAARVEAELGGHVALYFALAGATPLTTDVPASAGDGPAASDPASPPHGTPGEARWTLSALGGLSVAFSAAGNSF